MATSSAINADDVAMFIASVTKDNVNISQNINGAFYTPVQYLARYGNTNARQMLDYLLFLGADLSLKADAATLPASSRIYHEQYIIGDAMEKCKPLNNKSCIKIGTLTTFNPNKIQYGATIIYGLLMDLDKGTYKPAADSENKEIIMLNAKKWKRSSWFPCVSKFSGQPWSEGCGVPGITHTAETKVTTNYSRTSAPAPSYGVLSTITGTFLRGGKKSRKAKSRRSNKTKKRRNTPSA